MGFTQSKEKRWANTKIIMVDFPVLFVCERNIVQGPMVTLHVLFSATKINFWSRWRFCLITLLTDLPVRRFVICQQIRITLMLSSHLIKAQSCGFKKFPDGKTDPDKSRVQEILSVSEVDQLPRAPPLSCRGRDCQLARSAERWWWRTDWPSTGSFTAVTRSRSGRSPSSTLSGWGWWRLSWCVTTIQPARSRSLTLRSSMIPRLAVGLSYLGCWVGGCFIVITETNDKIWNWDYACRATRNALLCVSTPPASSLKKSRRSN